MFPYRHQARSRYRAENNPHREILRKPYLYIVHISLYPLSAERTVCLGSVANVDTPQLPGAGRRSTGVTSGASCERCCACPGSRRAGGTGEFSAESPSCAVPWPGWWHAPVASWAGPLREHGAAVGQREQLQGWGTSLVPSLLCWVPSIKP